MAALTAGTKAPDVVLKTVDGKAFSLRDQLEKTPVVLAFFKISCPVCQYALPFLERLHKAYGDKNVLLIGVSQDNAKDTTRFMQEFGVTFPVLLEESGYAVSNAYGLTNVPSVFWVGQDSEIEISSVGWIKADFEQVGRKMAETSKKSTATVFKPGEDIRDFRAG